MRSQRIVDGQICPAKMAFVLVWIRFFQVDVQFKLLPRMPRAGELV
jgi:hypothetical protein